MSQSSADTVKPLSTAQNTRAAVKNGKPVVSVSVVIPSYQSGAFLARTLRAVLAQTCAAHQIIVVDDESTDHTPEVAAEFSQHILYIRQPIRSGVAKARNRGIEAATGQWIALLDADDEWLPENLERCMAVLDADTSLRWCCATNIMTTPDGREQPPMSEQWRQMCGLTPDSARIFDALAVGAPFQTSGMVIRRDVFEQVGMFDAELPHGEDRDMWYRIGIAYPRIGYVWPPTMRYLRHLGSMTAWLRDRCDSLLLDLDRNAARARQLDDANKAAFTRVLAVLAQELVCHALNMGRPDCLAGIRDRHGELLSGDYRVAVRLGSHMPTGVLRTLSAIRRRWAALRGRWVGQRAQ